MRSTGFYLEINFSYEDKNRVKLKCGGRSNPYVVCWTNLLWIDVAQQKATRNKVTHIILHLEQIW